MRGRAHISISNLITTQYVKFARPHLKFLSGNYLTYGVRAAQSGGSPRCRLCLAGQESGATEESVSHVISTCSAMEEERIRLLAEFSQLCTMTQNSINFGAIKEDEKQLCQFVLDPTSLSLPNQVSLNDPLVTQFYRLSREYCFLIDKTRIRLLKEKEKEMNI